MEILIGLIVMGLLAHKAINLYAPKQTHVRIEPIAHEPTAEVHALRVDYARLHGDALALEAQLARTSHPLQRAVLESAIARKETDLWYVEQSLTLRGCAPTNVH